PPRPSPPPPVRPRARPPSLHHPLPIWAPVNPGAFVSVFAGDLPRAKRGPADVSRILCASAPRREITVVIRVTPPPVLIPSSLHGECLARAVRLVRREFSSTPRRWLSQRRRSGGRGPPLRATP